jgi:hypothetical protein
LDHMANVINNNHLKFTLHVSNSQILIHSVVAS